MEIYQIQFIWLDSKEMQTVHSTSPYHPKEREDIEVYFCANLRDGLLLVEETGKEPLIKYVSDDATLANLVIADR